jgi:hypothetical protein
MKDKNQKIKKKLEELKEKRKNPMTGEDKKESEKRESSAGDRLRKYHEQAKELEHETDPKIIEHKEGHKLNKRLREGLQKYHMDYHDL